ncbi:hypothetical protein [Saccharopolyspora pogona]|uniref:hypothetical protein n=1 Tax=Saccharopolyspora pogona TaxID=333966 RepID=UPI0016852AB9|nr:hypothetical protein [Saccharopolyspora pogona]
MTRWEMLEALSRQGEGSFDPDFDGWVSWHVMLANGDFVLSVSFIDDNTGDTFDYEWVLNPKEGE